MKKKAFGGIFLLLTAIALLLYAIGFGPSVFGLPIHKLIFAGMILASIIAKMIYSDTLSEKFKIFTLLSVLFMILEPHIAEWANLESYDVINNWLLLLAAILIDISLGILIPKGKSSRWINHHTGSSIIHYADVSESRYHSYSAQMSSVTIYYQNADTVETGSTVELELSCNMGSILVYAPEDWTVVDEIDTNMGSTCNKSNGGGRVTLKITGDNNMGSITIN